MTTPPDPDGTGSNGDAPYLPPSRPMPPPEPSVHEPPTQPTGTGALAQAAIASTPPTARASADAPRRPLPAPAEASPPPDSVGGVSARHQLRMDAKRRRRRNARIGWVITVLLFGGAVVAGWFVYHGFDDDVSGTEAAPASSDVAAEGGDVQPEAAPVPSVPSEDLPTWAGLTPVTDEPGEPPAAAEFDTVPPDQTGPPPRIANRPPFRTVLYDLRYYDGVEPDATFWNYEVTYDTLSDDYFGFVSDSASGESELVVFTGSWRHSVGADGVNRRVRRSELSVNSEPDTPLAALLGELDVLPLEARPFATLMDEQPNSGLGLDGSAMTSFGYRLDLDSFRAAAPEAYETWRGLWSNARLDNVELIVPGTEQVRLSEVEPYPSLSDREQTDMSHLEFTLPDGRAAIIFAISESGIVSLATVIAPEDDLRVIYTAYGIHDEPTILTLPEDGWVDAP